MPTTAKAIVAAVLAGIAAALASAIGMVDDGLTASEVLGILLAFLTGGGVTGAATWRVPNGYEDDPDTSTPGPGGEHAP